MRYKKGSKVEVLCRNEFPSSSWRCAEIICGNGRTYTVRYDTDLDAVDEAIVQRVSRKDIRPCPPPVELENWVPGDVVEAFQNYSWKMAIVSKFLERNCFLVRLVGSSHEYKLRKIDLRVRQCWEDDKWFVIGEGASYCEDRTNGEWSMLKHNYKLSPQVKEADSEVDFQDENCAAKNDANFQRSRIVSSRALKRRFPNSHSQVEACPRTSQKFRVVEKEGRRHQLLAANTSPLPKKVDAVASHQETLGETHIYTSFNKRTTHFIEEHMEREKPSGAVGCSRAISLEPNDADNVTCSVGSCSITSSNSFKLPCGYGRGSDEDTEGNFSDAESVFQLGYEEGNCHLPSQEELAAEIHTLELHAYRCTMEALHALGPLSWEQETLVTNLRLSLHISNDEHLMEIRHLVSTATSMPCR